MSAIELRDAEPDDLPMARRILGLAFATEPFTENMYGAAPLDRLRGSLDEYRRWPADDQLVVVATIADTVVGVAGATRGGSCHRCDRPAPPLSADATRAERVDHEFLARVTVGHQSFQREPHGHIASVAVDPAAQGLGVGRVLVPGLIEWLRSERSEPILLECVTGRAAFYEHCGFTRLEEFDDPGAPGLRAVLMRRDH